jgi:hypoxanthine phosphoribosyltransferase
MPTPRPLISRDRLRSRVRALGRRIAADYRGRDLHLIGVLHGAFVFMADLSREMGLPLTCDFLRVSSYGSGTASSGRVRFKLDLDRPIRGRHVLLVEDIVDTGTTAAAVLAALRRRAPASLRLCALLHKPSRTRTPVTIDYVGFSVPDRFVVGYGMDLDARWRNLPYIGVLDGSKAR